MLCVNTESEEKGNAQSSPELPDVIDPTVAADSLREHTATLVKAFRHCLSSLADSLYSQSIIPEDAHRKALNKYLDEDERSRALVSCVEARLEIEPSDLKKFVDILKSEPFLGTLGSKLVQNYCTLSSIPTTKCPVTISPAISQYAAYLKGVYRNSPISPDSKWPPTPSKKYINLTTVEYEHKCRDEFIGQTLHGDIKEILYSREEISVNEILVSAEEGVAYLKLVLIEGAPGIGKSTLAWELCRRWEQSCMKNYSLAILLRLREKEVQEIRSIVELFYSCPSKYKDVLLNEISSSNGKGVLFILDGFDELPTSLQRKGFLVDLIRGTFLPECTIVVTSRPSATAELLKICRPQIQKRIEVLGFTQESVEEYATSIFSSQPERLQKFKAFISASDNPAINSLMYVPLNAAIIVEIYCHSKSDHLLPHTLTQVYTQLCLTILNRYLETSLSSIALVNKFKDLPDHLYQEFLKLSEAAFDGMRRQEVIFHTLPSDLVHFGFLDAVPSLYGGGNVSYNFLHLTLQEFFAAYHISQLCGDARLALLKECGSYKHWNIVWRFVAGLTEFKFFEGYLESDLFIQREYYKEVLVHNLLIQCLFEANIKMYRPRLFGFKNIKMVFSSSRIGPALYYDTSKPDVPDDTSLLDVVCAPSSLKSLHIANPNNIFSLNELKGNTRLTELVVYSSFDNIEVLAKVTVEILLRNKLLEHVTILGNFSCDNIDILIHINGALYWNKTLKNITIDDITYEGAYYDDLDNFMNTFVDPRLSLVVQDPESQQTIMYRVKFCTCT